MMLLLNKANVSNRTASTLCFIQLTVHKDGTLDGVSGIRNHVSLHTLQVLHLLPTKFFYECI